MDYFEYKDNVCDTPLCAWPDCTKEGSFRAPKSPKNMGVFVYFCLQHIREYNAKWNYLSGFSEKEIENFIRESVVWERPTWPLGAGRGKEKRPPPPKPRRNLPADVCAALGFLGLPLGVDPETMKTQYRKLVKKYHPDANNGSSDHIKRFHEVQKAWGTLQDYFSRGS